MKLKTSIFFIILLGISLFANYTIRTGDVLGLWVFGYPEYSNQKILVGPDGQITVPPIGRLNAYGKTIETLEKEIKEKISTYIKSPNVTLGIVNYAPFEVQVIGNVKRSGIIQLPKPALTLTKIISLSGGFAEPWKSTYAIVKYPNGKEEKYNITNLFKGLLLEKDPVVPENSTIVIPFEYNTNITVYTDFGIKNIPYFNGITLKDIVSNSNINPQNFESSIIVLRNNKILNFSFEDLKDNKNILLEKGDTVIFNKLEKYVYVFGLNKGGKILFEKDEPFTLKTLMAKLGVEPKYVTYTIYDKEKGKLDNVQENFDLKVGEIIEFESIENYVYVSSNVGGGKILFDVKENFDLNTLLGKMGIDKNDYTVEIFNPENGLTIDATQNFSFVKGMIVKFTPIEKYVYVANKGKILFSKTETFDLDTLIGKLGIDKQMSEIKIFDPDSKETFVADKNIPLKNNMYIDIIPVEKFVYVADKGKVLFSKTETFDLDTLIGKLGIDKQMSEIKIFDPDSKETFVADNNIPLKNNMYIDIIPVEKFVYVADKGKVLFSKTETFDLDTLIGKLGIDKQMSEIKIFDPDSKETFVADNNIPLKNNMYIDIIPVEKFVYVADKGKVLFSKTETFDLDTLIGKLGIDKQMSEIKIFDPDSKETFVADNNIPLKNNMYIDIIPVEKFVYVADKGKVLFSKTETFDLDTLIGKLGIDKQMSEIKIFDPDSKETFVADKNIPLKNNMYIDIIPIKKFVYVVGDISKTIYFDKKENIDKKTILAKLGLTEDKIENFEYDKLEPGSIIKIKIKKNYVYTSGAFNYTGRLDFDISEPITLSAIISKARGFNNEFNGELILVNNNTTKTLTIEENKIYNDIIEPGTMIMAKASRRDVYILGDGVSNGVYTAKLNDSLWNVLLRAGYVPSDKYEIEVKYNETIKKYNGIEAEQMLNKIPISGEIYVNVKKVKNDNVLIYKNGSVKVITPKIKDYVTLIDVFSSVNGFSPSNEGTIMVYNNEKKIAEYNSLDVINNPLAKIPQGSYVNFVLDVNLNYITVLGSTTPRSIKTEIAIPLTEILGQLSIDWRTQKYIDIYKPNGNMEKIDLDKVKELNTVLIQPGSVVYVPSTHNQYVYVFGEVLHPGMIPYTKGLNVIEALFKAGVNTQTAELSNVFLFTDGPNQPPIVLNLKDFYNGGNVPDSMNKLLEPGNIIYIPKNILTNVVSVMSTVNNFMSFFNTGYTTYNNINNIITGK
ncbi:polysaccharide biosynthesis/export family protein [Marinitoga aeolica]|uniref:Polysaccharide biosynthesis/export family protein n=1 Tax=Marinitoga aeolica TaxID=2809031 RepID=A0ABY8PPM3_9BACT|nr:polysaccharide biosynthesis/export family protein [Marinitoga aeolica]WGS64541.1 polysaccharide biosynthesis/export family protein [Marinitoga aeolica]